MGRGSVGGGGRGHVGGSHSHGGFGSSSSRSGGVHIHTSSGGFWNGLFLGSLLSRNGGSSGGSGNNQNISPVKYKKTRNKVATTVLGLLFIAFAIACIVCANVFTYKSTDATVEKYNITTEYGYKFYFAVYTYSVNGKDYTSESQLCFDYEGRDPNTLAEYKPGTTQRIKYKKTDPNKIYEADASDQIEDDYAVIWWFFAVGCIIASMITFAVGVNKTEIIEESATASEPAATENKNKCKYCGNTLTDDDKFCSGCGARRG